MVEGPIRRFLTAARSAISGDFSSTTRVVDTLLDLRQRTDTTPELEATIDSLLASMPGQTVVDNEWWRNALDELERSGDGDGQRSAATVDA